MRSGRCSWKCFATGLLISTLLCITLVMLGALVAIPVIYARYKVISDKDQVSTLHVDAFCVYLCNEHLGTITKQNDQLLYFSGHCYLWSN